jgi:hypothetical protein
MPCLCRGTWACPTWHGLLARPDGPCLKRDVSNTGWAWLERVARLTVYIISISCEGSAIEKVCRFGFCGPPPSGPGVLGRYPDLDGAA